MTRSLSALPADIRIYLFGSIRVEGVSNTILLPTRKTESLLAYLALYPEPHAREKLAALFWGDVTDSLARGSLRKALTLLRKRLGDAVFIADRETVQLNPDYPIWVDAREFRQTVSADPHAAIALYSGDLLNDFYDEWVLSERERYRSLYIKTLLRLTQEMRAQSEYAHAIGYAQQVLACDRANERAHQHLMFCHLMTGEREAALQQYGECQRALQEGLDVEPAPETTALYHWILQTPSAVPALEARITNLPIPLTSFIGRKSAMAEVKQRILYHRLVTLTGTGGSGKTRLAIQVATDLIDEFRDGVWWVELAALTDASLVPFQIAKALGVQDIPNQPLNETLTNWLRSRTLLLVLDNCEHLLAACAQLADGWLGRSSSVKILATSREALGIAGEVAWHVSSLSVPETRIFSLIALLSSFESICLFAERASATNRGFALTVENAAAVARICQQLDGIPLAIELAAARVNALSVDQIAARLDDRFSLLTDGSRAALPRQRTLRATIAWSYDLLSSEERFLFCRLSVFSGGWTLEAAESVCAGDGLDRERVFDLLARLIDKSLVVVEEQDRAARYRMLETIRQYARGKLLGSGESENARNRHLEYFLRFAEEAEPRLYTADQGTWIRRLEGDLDNLRAALEWAQESGNLQSALRLVGVLPAGCTLTPRQVRAWIERLLTSADTATYDNVRAKALLNLGNLCFELGDCSIARARLTEALEISRETGNEAGIAESLYRLGTVAYYQKKYRRARVLYESSLSISRAVGAMRITAYALHMLGHVMHGLDDLAQAHALFEESASELRRLGDWMVLALPLSDLAREAQRTGDFSRARSIFEENLGVLEKVGDRWGMALMLVDLGYLALTMKDLETAQAHLWKGLSLFRQHGDKRFIAECLEGFAGLAVAQAQPNRAARLLAAAQALRQATGIPVPPYRQPDYERFRAAAEAALEQAAWQRECGEGRALSLDQAIAYALETKTEG